MHTFQTFKGFPTLYFLFYVCGCLRHVCLAFLEARETIGLSENGCELPGGCWDSTPGPLQEQPVLVTAEHLSSPLPPV